MKAVFYNINNCVSTEEFDMDFNPYHINDVINLDTTCIKINQDDGEKHNLIEQIAMEKVRELIKTSGTNNLDVEIHYVTLL